MSCRSAPSAKAAQLPGARTREVPAAPSGSEQREPQAPCTNAEITVITPTHPAFGNSCYRVIDGRSFEVIAYCRMMHTSLLIEKSNLIPHCRNERADAIQAKLFARNLNKIARGTETQMIVPLEKRDRARQTRRENAREGAHTSPALGTVYISFFCASRSSPVF